MKRISIVFIAVVGITLFFIFGNNYSNDIDSSKSNVVNSNLNGSEKEVTSNNVIPSTQNNSFASTTSSVTPSKIEEKNTLTPEEIVLWTSWSETRGYARDESFFSEYESMNAETLQSLASQNDPKAHLVLANRLIAAQPARKASLIALNKAAEHLYAASVLGYTATLSQLSDLMESRAFLEAKPNRKLIIESYKYAYLGSKRGDPNSETRLSLLTQSLPLSSAEEKAAIQDAETAYNEMSKARTDLGFEPFDNEVPLEITNVVKKLRNQASGQ